MTNEEDKELDTLSATDIALIKERLASVLDGTRQTISFEQLLEGTGFTEEDLENIKP